MVAFIGNSIRRKVSGEDFDELIASRQNLSDFSPSKVCANTVECNIQFNRLFYTSVH